VSPRDMILVRLTPEQRRLVINYSQESGISVEQMKGRHFVQALGMTVAEELHLVQKRTRSTTAQGRAAPLVGFCCK
jgi:hypothetical protein